eukprot:TRINITY_DN258_c0_g1_i6.p2 TRINITY_DN258_c0_g1~~TRINITY_DN258_c0_g1_i6.p2  ORF type:complete len:180 (+),score=56.73 TRINITY_DN258_c0_g1_i6:42-581(+)
MGIALIQRGMSKAQAGKTQEQPAQKAAPKKGQGVKKKAIRKAKVKGAGAKGAVRRRSYLIRTKPRFYRPHTLRLRRAPKYERNTRSINPVKGQLDKYSILIHPLSTEKAMGKMENENTLVYIVSQRATKPQIREAFREVHKVEPRKVNTLLRTDGKKKAYIRLGPDAEALTLANKIGLI